MFKWGKHVDLHLSILEMLYGVHIPTLILPTGSIEMFGKVVDSQSSVRGII